MKPINSPKASEKARHSQRRNNFQSAIHRVEIDFYPHSSWTIKVGNVWPVRELAPIELVIAGENKKRAQWQASCLTALWAEQF